MINILPDEISLYIWNYLFPIKQLKNIFIQKNKTINCILKKSNYCEKCGENSKCSKCEFCNDIYYFYCTSCKYSYGNNLVCCTDFYNKYGMLN